MLKWLTAWITDVLVAVALAALLLGYAAVAFPEHFPQQLAHYWSAAKVKTAHTATVPAALATEQVSAVIQMQR